MRTLLVAAIVLGAAAADASAQGYRRGQEVSVKTADGQPAAPAVQRIIATPGDRIRIDGKTIAVNDRALTDVSPNVLLTCGAWDQVVPTGHYFLVGEQVENASTSRSCSLLPANRIIGAAQR
jgi:signal peptidase I